MRKCTLRAYNRITAKLSSLYPHWWVQGQLTPMNKGEMEIRNMRLKSPAFRVTGLDTRGLRACLLPSLPSAAERSRMKPQGRVEEWDHEAMVKAWTCSKVLDPPNRSLSQTSLPSSPPQCAKCPTLNFPRLSFDAFKLSSLFRQKRPTL